MVSFPRKILCMLITTIVVCSLVGCHQKPDKNIYEGMTFEDFKEKNSDESYFQYAGYLFSKNNEDDHVVARMSDDYTVIERMICFKAESIDNSDHAFWKIREGMTVEQVVATVGIPEGSYTSGMITLAFKSDTGARYVVYLSAKKDEKSTEYYVDCIKPLDQVVIADKGLFVQVKVGMSSNEVYELLGPTEEVEKGTVIEEFRLSDGEIVYFSYAEGAEGNLQVDHITMVNPAE